MTTLGTFIPDNLVVGTQAPLITDMATLEADGGQDLTLEIGTVLARKASGLCVIIDSGDPTTADPWGVLAEAVTVLQGVDKQAPIYLGGEFNVNKLVFGGTDDIDTHRVGLRNIGIFARNVSQA